MSKKVREKGKKIQEYPSETKSLEKADWLKTTAIIYSYVIIKEQSAVHLKPFLGTITNDKLCLLCLRDINQTAFIDTEDLVASF